MRPMLATRGAHVPDGATWVHEVKWDGMRTLVHVSPERVRLTSRNENDVSVSFPELQGLSAVGRGALLDGEVVALGSGAPSFADLAERMHVGDARRAARLAERNPVTLLVFDLLAIDGVEVLARPLRERRDLLLGLGLDDVAWQVPPTYDDGSALLEAARAQGLEGIVSKRLSSPYRPGARSKDWLKFPIRRTGSYVVGGYRHEIDSDSRLGAVLVGEPVDDWQDGGLRYRGRVGSGLAGAAGQRLLDLLSPVARQPFVDEVPLIDRRGTVWVEPTLVVDVEYLTLTPDGRLRQPSYRGVRRDLDPDDVAESAVAGQEGGEA